MEPDDFGDDRAFAGIDGGEVVVEESENKNSGSNIW